MAQNSFSRLTTLGIVVGIVSVVASIDRVLSKIKETAVSFLQNLIPSRTQKEASAAAAV